MLLKGKEYIKISFLCLLFAFSFQQITAQETSKKEEKKSRSLVRKAERAKSANDFSEAEAAYRRALSKDLKNAEASYNFGHLYGDKEMEMESMSQLLKTAKNASSKELKHKAFHNLGNTYMKQKDYAQAVNAYKDALRNNPADEETRYNLAVAQEMLEKNPDQNEDNDQDQDDDDENEEDENSRDNKESQDQDQDEDEDEDGDEDENQDQDQDENEEDQDEESGENDENENEEDENQDDQQEEQENQDQNPDDEMSDEHAENLLRAADNLEKDVQRKLNEEKGEKTPTQPNQKDW